MRNDLRKLARFKLPPGLLILDGVGALLLGLGLAEWLTRTELLPAALRFPYHEAVLILVGAAMMAPAIRFLVRAVLKTLEEPGAGR